MVSELWLSPVIATKVHFVSDLLFPERCNAEFTFPATLFARWRQRTKKKKKEDKDKFINVSVFWKKV